MRVCYQQGLPRLVFLHNVTTVSTVTVVTNVPTVSIYFHTVLLQLKTIADMFVHVFQSLLKGGAPWVWPLAFSY